MSQGVGFKVSESQELGPAPFSLPLPVDLGLELLATLQHHTGLHAVMLLAMMTLD